MRRCTDCYTTHADELQLSCCPTCGTTSLPSDTKDDVTLAINWHELRILTIWATNYAKHSLPDDGPGQRTLKSIIGRLQDQHQERIPLTLDGEFKKLSKHAEVQVIGPDGKTKVYPHRKPD